MKRSVLFVCTGNICRSPSAEGILKKIAREQGVDLRVESRGTHDYHVGEPPDDRSQQHARKRGYDLSAQRAKQVSKRDFEEFDLIVAMDRGHLAILRRLCPPAQLGKVKLFENEVPDPYYGGPDGFERVLDLLEAGCRSLLGEIEGK